MKENRSKLKKKLDAVFSKFIRERDSNTCFFKGRNSETYKIGQCGGPMCNFHILSRVSTSTRWDEENCVCSCFGHNMAMEHVPLEFYRLFEKLRGREWLDDMRIKWKQSRHFTLDELRSMIKKYSCEK
jgi:hypothetical protein